MAAKWKASYESGRKYTKTWESKFIWLSKASDGSEDGYCKLCHTQMKPKLSNLAKHEKARATGESLNVSKANSSCAKPNDHRRSKTYNN